jgi:hypothetical protein
LNIPSISLDELRDVLQANFDVENSVFNVLLTDGTMLIVELRIQAGITSWNGKELPPPTMDKLWLNEGGVETRVYGDESARSKSWTITIPFDSIAVIEPTAFSQETLGETYDDPPVGAESWRTVFGADLVSKSEEHGFLVETTEFQVAYAEAPKRPIYGAFSPDRNLLLYCDWEFFKKRKGGLTGLGAGFAGFSLAYNNETSLWAKVEKLVDKHVTDIGGVCKLGQDVAILKGYPLFYDLSELSPEEKLLYAVETDGELWWPMAITERQFESASVVKGNGWAHALTSNDLNHVWPPDVWKRVGKPLRFYVELIQGEIDTQFGSKSCFVKVRAVVALAKDSPH